MQRNTMQLEEILNKINSAVEKYHHLELKMVSDQSEILRDLTTSLFFLESHRVEAYEKWHEAYNLSSEKTNAGKQRDADFQVQELYMIRRIMTGAYKVVDSIRSTISVNRKENG